MTNKDKYLREGVSVEEFITAFIKKENISINSLEVDQINHFLKSEVTPKLTEDERVILKQVSKAYVKFGKNGYGQFIFRIDNGEPFLLNNTAEKIFDGLFQFIKERRRI